MSWTANRFGFFNLHLSCAQGLRSLGGLISTSFGDRHGEDILERMTVLRS